MPKKTEKKRTHRFTQEYGARPSAGHYTDSRYARDQSSATHLKFFFCIVVLRTTSSSAYALQKTSFFALECSISVIFFVIYIRTYGRINGLRASPTFLLRLGL